MDESHTKVSDTKPIIPWMIMSPKEEENEMAFVFSGNRYFKRQGYKEWESGQIKRLIIGGLFGAKRVPGHSHRLEVKLGDEISIRRNKKHRKLAGVKQSLWDWLLW